MKLTPKQEKFTLKYFECGNASEAYRYAYNTEKMKKNTIKRKASELLSNGNITATVNKLRDEAKKDSQYTVEKLIELHTEIIQLGMGKKASTRTVIEGIGKGFSQATEVETTDTNLPAAKASAVEIGKLLGFYTEKHEHSGEISLNTIVDRLQGINNE